MFGCLAKCGTTGESPVPHIDVLMTIGGKQTMQGGLCWVHVECARKAGDYDTRICHHDNAEHYGGPPTFVLLRAIPKEWDNGLEY